MMSLLTQGQAAIGRGDTKAAIKLLEQAIAETPNDARAHYLLGVAYGRRAEQRDARAPATYAVRSRDEFEKAVSLDPNEADARMALVQYYTLAPDVMGGSIEKAERQAAELLKRNPADGHRANAFIDEHLKKYDEAAAELRQASALDPNDMPTWFEIGHVAAISGNNLSEGEAALEKYLEYKPAADEPTHEQAIAELETIRRQQARTRH